MTTLRENILARIKTNLDTISGVSVYRVRTTPLARGEVPAIVLEPVSDSPSEDSFVKTMWTFQVKCSVFVRNDAPGNTADAFVEEVHSKIMADPTCNGNALDIDAGNTDFSFFDADVPLGVVEMNFLVKYRTDREDLTAA